jgi:hypothetical protein
MGRFLLSQLPKWVNGNSLLLVTISGLLTRLYCPFVVECLESCYGLKKGSKYKVERVGVGDKVQLIYFITGRAYSYRYFKVIGRV